MAHYGVAILKKNYHQLLRDTQIIKAGADVIVTNTFRDGKD